jgi:ketosteroid isomerase-like protein
MASDPTSFRREIGPLIEELFASANAHDADRHVALYWRDAALIFVVNGEIIRGWDAYREAQRRWWDDGRATGSYEMVGDPAYEFIDVDCGLTTLAMHARSKSPDGQILEREIAFTGLWRRGSTGWRIVYAHESMRPRNAPPS